MQIPGRIEDVPLPEDETLGAVPVEGVEADGADESPEGCGDDAEATMAGSISGSWAYIAGFFDGEGTISVRMSTERTGVAWSLAQSHARGIMVLSRIQKFLALHGIKSSLYKPRTDKCNCLYVCRRSDVILIIEKLMPYLVVKRLECQDTWRLLKWFPAIQRGAILGMRIREGRQRGIKERGYDRKPRA